MNRPDENEPPEKSDNWKLARYAALGLELSGSLIGLTLIGYWVDYAFETAPAGLITGAVLGVVAGMYNLIRQSLAMMSPTRRKRDDDGGRRSDGKR